MWRGREREIGGEREGGREREKETVGIRLGKDHYLVGVRERERQTEG